MRRVKATCRSTLGLDPRSTIDHINSVKTLIKQLNIAFIPSSKTYLKNRIFIENFRDNCNEPQRLLRQELLKNDIELNTVDISKSSPIDVLVCTRFDYNALTIKKIVREHNCACIYIVTEEETVCPLHAPIYLEDPLYDFVLTWRTDLIDEDRYKSCFFPSPIKEISQGDFDLEKKLRKINIINSFKKSRSTSKTDLYNYRINLACELAKIGFCDIFGIGWPKTTPGYCGPVESKKPVQTRYLFTLCIENTLDEPGAITEKIFDAFEAGSIPLYLGASDIEKFIPKNLFINLRERCSAEDVIRITNEITDEDARECLSNIQAFMRSDAYEKFSSKGYVKAVSSVIQQALASDSSATNRINSSRRFWWAAILDRPMFFLTNLRKTCRLLF